MPEAWKLAPYDGAHLVQPGPAGPLLVKGFQKVKKLLLVAVIGAGAFALWRKAQADRAELDLWTEATTGDSD